MFRFPLSATKNTGNSVKTTMGNIGLFINGVALFDPRDGVSWNNAQQRILGGPIMGKGDGIWNRDAIVAERAGFDCSKGHPAMGNYHHHQNPSAFKLDKNVIYDVCSLYDAEGLYTINPGMHSPLIGFAYDGFPVYGAFGFKQSDGTGGIVRMKSGYQLRSITNRTHYANGTDVTDGPTVNTTFPLGYFIEDYEFIAHPGEDDYLDAHNGRFCITPEYPNGTYAYFCSVDEQWNSAYPYAVGPTFYGSIVAAKVQSVSEPVETYSSVSAVQEIQSSAFTIFFGGNDILIIQSHDLIRNPLEIKLFDIQGKMVSRTILEQGSTIAHLDCSVFHDGIYIVNISSGSHSIEQQIIIKHS
ncbi:MAG: YHYH protein [Bacteroidota bacterium]